MASDEYKLQKQAEPKFWTVRHPNEDIFDVSQFDTLHADEWDEESIGRLDEQGWDQRYTYESTIIDKIIADNPNIKTVLELGPGPGLLAQKVLAKHPNLTYHLIDKEHAKKYFDDNNLKGEFFVKDLSAGFDTEGLLDTYDLIITNDFLEHVLNPSAIVQQLYKITHDESRYLVSNPNWRMGHQYVYRGLFDFDNIIYFLKIHGFVMDGGKLWGSPLKTPEVPRLDSEQMLPDALLNSWNHYILLVRKQTYNNGKEI
mgnify:FL=1